MKQLPTDVKSFPGKEKNLVKELARIFFSPSSSSLMHSESGILVVGGGGDAEKVRFVGFKLMAVYTRKSGFKQQ